MQNNNPNDPSQQTPAVANPEPFAQSDQPYGSQNVQPVNSYGSQNAQPGYPYGSQHTQPGYPLPGTYLPPTYNSSNAPTWYAPGTAGQTGMQPQEARPFVATSATPARSKTRSAAIFALTCLLAVVFGVGLFAGWTFARSSGSTGAATSGSASPSATVSTSLDSQTEREAAIAKITPAVVEVLGQVSQGTALGSGVIVDKSGDIITNNHVVTGVNVLQVVLNDGRTVSAQLVANNAANDLAIVRIQPYTGMVVAAIGDSSKLTVGQEVVALGNPLGYSGTATSGVVSALNRSARESNAVRLSGLIQISAPINPGNSGGALVNLQGEVVGIPTLSAVNSETNTPANGIGFAIPSSQVKTTLTQFLG